MTTVERSHFVWETSNPGSNTHLGWLIDQIRAADVLQLPYVTITTEFDIPGHGRRGADENRCRVVFVATDDTPSAPPPKKPK